MICAMTARRIKPGQSEEFLDAFAGQSEQLPAEIRERFKTVLACRQVDDPDVLVNFGIFDGTLEELRELQAMPARAGQLNLIEPFVEEKLFDGSFEIVRDYIAEASGTPSNLLAGAAH